MQRGLIVLLLIFCCFHGAYAMDECFSDNRCITAPNYIDFDSPFQKCICGGGGGVSPKAGDNITAPPPIGGNQFPPEGLPEPKECELIFTEDEQRWRCK
jgi:hypothetical protein